MARYPQTVLVSCPVPWDEEDRLLEDVFRQEIRLTLGLGFNDLYIFGTGGEGHAVTDDEFRQIVDVFAQETVDQYAPGSITREPRKALTSTDGLTWRKDPQPNVVFGGRYDAEKCSEPCVMRLADGRYRMFYEACDELGVWRILSCTARQLGGD